jgi:hypothetical protein
MRRPVLIAVACLALAGCGGGSPSLADCQDQAFYDENTEACLDVVRDSVGEAIAEEEANSAAEEVDRAGEGVPVVEGPVTEPGTFPGDLTAEVVDVTTAAEADPYDPANDTRVLVTVRFTNTGTEVFAWSSDPNVIDAGPDGDLLYGENRFPAHAYYNDQNNLPTQLVPGSSAEWTGLFYMPGAELGTLAVSVSPERGTFQPWTFTGVETLAAG